MMLGLGLGGLGLGCMAGGGEAWTPATPGGLVVLQDITDLSTLFQDTAATSPITAAAQTLARANDKSGNGNHASQSNVSLRPIIVRVPVTVRRNLATYTDSLGASGWSNVQGASTVIPSAYTSSSGIIFEKVVPAAITLIHGRRQSTSGFVAGQQYTIRQLVKRSDAGINFEIFAYTGASHNAVFNLTSGAVSDTLSCTASIIGPDTDGIFDCRMTFTAASNITNNVDLRLTRATVRDQQFAGDASAGLLMARHQREAGATATAYQKVVSAYDVTEAGVADRWYLRDDNVDDVMPVALTGTYSLYWAVSGALQYTENVVASGLDTLRDGMWACAVYDHALTAGERAQLATYWGVTP